MFWKGEKFFYPVSDLAFFEVAIQHHTDQILENPVDVLLHHSKRGMCRLTLGIATNCAALLQSAIDDFLIIACNKDAQPGDVALSKTNISLVRKALRTMEVMAKQ